MASDEGYAMLFKIVIIGDSYVGKTNILSKYLKMNLMKPQKPQLELNLEAKRLLKIII